MRIVWAVAVLLAIAALAACGTDGGGRATDPAGDPTGSTAPTGMPSAIPAASGMVSTRDLATVMDTGSPELCLGAVAESYPPQCRGIPLEGWSWQDHDGVFEKSGQTRWGLFAVNGTFDGETLTVRSAVAGALYDPGPAAPLATPCEDLPNADCDGPSEARLAQIQEELQDLPGVLTLSATRFAVQADVVFDDGSLQAWADETYGGGVVVISSALVPLTR